MGRAVACVMAICLAAGFLCAQADEPDKVPPDNRTVIGEGNSLLAAGALAIRLGRYDEGIRLTRLGLERPGNTRREQAAALSNLCAAHAGKHEPDAAIQYCSKSLALDPGNWHAYSNRSFAYWLKGMYSQATFDVDAAAALAPKADQVRRIREMINESRLEPHVAVEEHP